MMIVHCIVDWRQWDRKIVTEVSRVFQYRFVANRWFVKGPQLSTANDERLKRGKTLWTLAALSGLPIDKAYLINGRDITVRCLHVFLLAKKADGSSSGGKLVVSTYTALCHWLGASRNAVSSGRIATVRRFINVTPQWCSGNRRTNSLTFGSLDTTNLNGNMCHKIFYRSCVSETNHPSGS